MKHQMWWEACRTIPCNSNIYQSETGCPDNCWHDKIRICKDVKTLWKLKRQLNGEKTVCGAPITTEKDWLLYTCTGKNAAYLMAMKYTQSDSDECQSKKKEAIDQKCHLKREETIWPKLSRTLNCRKHRKSSIKGSNLALIISTTRFYCSNWNLQPDTSFWRYSMTAEAKVIYNRSAKTSCCDPSWRRRKNIQTSEQHTY